MRQTYTCNPLVWLYKPSKVLCLLIGFTLLLSFPFTGVSQTCQTTEGCIDFQFISQEDLENGNTLLCFDITNRCNSKLEQVLFEHTGSIQEPRNMEVFTSENNIAYQVTQPVQLPFPGVQFTTQGAGILNGQTDRFCYTVPTSSLEGIHTLRMEAQVADIYYQTYLNYFDCLPAECNNIYPWQGGYTMFNFSLSTNGVVCRGEGFGLNHVADPVGGSGAIEYAWLKCTNPANGECGGDNFGVLLNYNVPQLFEDWRDNGGPAQIDTTCWAFASDDDLDDRSLAVPDGIQETTCYIRCARRENCTAFTGEGVMMKVEVEDCEDGDGGGALAESIVLPEEPIQPESKLTAKFKESMVFPNPSPNFVWVDLRDFINDNLVLLVSDEVGHTHLSKTIDQNQHSFLQLDLRALSNGIYIIWIHSGGDKPIAEKVMIMK